MDKSEYLVYGHFVTTHNKITPPLNPSFSCARRLITPHILFSYSICEPFSGKVAEATIIKTLGNPSNRTEIRPNCYLHTQNKICFTDRASLIVSVTLSETWETSWIKCCANLLLDLQKEHRLLMVSFDWLKAQFKYLERVVTIWFVIWPWEESWIEDR